MAGNSPGTYVQGAKVTLRIRLSMLPLLGLIDGYRMSGLGCRLGLRTGDPWSRGRELLTTDAWVPPSVRASGRCRSLPQVSHLKGLRSERVPLSNTRQRHFSV